MDEDMDESDSEGLILNSVGILMHFAYSFLDSKPVSLPAGPSKGVRPSMPQVC
jgi:hypothetical protein